MKKLYLLLGLLSSFAALAMDAPGTAKEEVPKIILGNINNNTDNNFNIYFQFGATPWLKGIKTIGKNEQKQFSVEIPITWGENMGLVLRGQKNTIALLFLLESQIRKLTVLIQALPEEGVARSIRKQFQIKPGFFKHNVLRVDITLQGKSPYFKESSINMIPLISPPTLAEISVQNMVKLIRAGKFTLESLKGNIPAEIIEKIQIELGK